MKTQLQFLRQCNVVVSTDAGAGLDLSRLRVKFVVKKTDGQTPNTADIAIYNVSPDVANRIRKEFTAIALQAGYESNFGIVFAGTIKQVRTGRENGTDSFLLISASDGDMAYNGATVNATLAAGATQHEQVAISAQSTAALGTPLGPMVPTDGVRLPRGKVMYGMARDYLRHSARALRASWSIQSGKIQFIALTGVLPLQMVVLNSKTGLIGTPEQTADGIKARCLLNPLLQIGGKVQIKQHDIAEAALPNTTAEAASNKPVTIQHDGVYRILTTDFVGDTHGQDWYTDVMCLGVNEALPPAKQVKLNG